jgi:NAD(P)-dependent dehydrogenase (short-subunit alcohol dehydrogenase family)
MPITLTYPTGGVLVVGGTGRVGGGVVRRMAAADVPVIFTYRGGNGRDGDVRSAALEQELRDKGHDVTRYRLDLSDTSAIDAAMEAVVAKTGRLLSVMCTAGPVVPFRKMVEFTSEEVEQFYQGDIFAYFRLYRSAVRIMRQSGGGSLIGTTTMANVRVVDDDGISATSKAAIDSLTRQIAAEEGIHGIRANSVGIGIVLEESIEEIKAAFPKPGSGPPTTREERRGLLLSQIYERSRLRRIAPPEEAGDLFAFLASNQAANITGQMFLFDGGITI